MGGYGSGRYGGRPTADASLRIDIAMMLRTGRAKEGAHLRSSVHWNCRGEDAGSISYEAIMNEPGQERLELAYTRKADGQSESVRQTIRLTFTRPAYGGKRWWMVCPYLGQRVGKLYKPLGGDRFASRQSWRLGYQSQRIAKRDRPFEATFRLQKKLGCPQGWEAGLTRPKGMWRRTFERHYERYWKLDDQCAAEAAAMMGVLDLMR